MAVFPSAEMLRDDVLEATSALTQIGTEKGTGSPEYQKALKGFAVAWFALRKTRNPHEFLSAVIV